MIKLSFICVVMLMFMACNKTDDKNKFRTEHLIAGDWYVNSHTIHYTAPSDSAVDLLINLNPCELDNYYQFFRDGLYTINSNSIHCHPDDSAGVLTTNNWILFNRDSNILLKTPEGIEEYYVATLNESTLTLIDSFINDSSTGVEIRTYMHIPLKK